MKKFRIMSLILCVVLLMGTLNAFAVKELENHNMLFEEDFDGVTAGEAPSTIFARNTNTTTTELVQNNDLSHSSNHLVMADDGDIRARAVFNSGAKVSSGLLCYEFDAMMEEGGHLQTAVVYDGEKDVTAKWFFAAYSNGTMSTFPNSGGAPSGTYIEKESTDKNYAIRHTLKGGNENLIHTKGNWHHYKFVIDIDNSSVTMYIDGNMSNTISGIAYINKDNAIGGLGFRKSAGEGLVKLDNIKAYVPGYITYSVEDECSTEHSSYKSWSLVDDTTLKSSIIKKENSRSLDATENVIKTNEIEDPENDVINIPNGAIGAYTIPECNKKLVIEFDYQVGNGGFGVVLREGTSFNWRSPYAARRSNSCYAVNDYTKSPASGNTTQYTIKGKNTALTSTSYQWDHAKIELDLSTGESVLTVNGVESNPITISYFKGMTVNGVGFRHYKDKVTNDVNDLFIDNVKISYSTDGNSISNIQSASNKFKMIFKDNVDMETITKDNIKIKSSQTEELTVVNDLVSNGRGVVVEVEQELTPGQTYSVVLPSTAKYTDGSNIVETTEYFTCVAGEFSGTIEFDEETPALTAGSTVSATANIVAKDLTPHIVALCIASFEGNMLIDAELKEVPVYTTEYTEKTENVSLTLTKNATGLKAFVWDENLVPLGNYAGTAQE